jgi:hypothetical protein
MTRIEELTNDAAQLHHVLLEDKTTADITLTYLPAIQRWQLDISHENLAMNCQLITVNPNMIRQWRNIAGFGLACFAEDGVDPFQIDDFINGRVQLYMLGPTDIDYVEDTIIGA